MTDDEKRLMASDIEDGLFCIRNFLDLGNRERVEEEIDILLALAQKLYQNL